MFFVVSKLMNFIINPMTWILFILLMSLFSSKHQKKLVFVSLSCYSSFLTHSFLMKFQDSEVKKINEHKYPI